LILLNVVLDYIANFYQICIWATARQDVTPKPSPEATKKQSAKHQEFSAFSFKPGVFSGSLFTHLSYPSS